MRTIPLVGLLLVVGCAPAEECDEMGCTIPSERFTQPVDETVAVTTVITTIPNRNGTNLIALGSADEMGIVQLKPRTSNFTSNINLFVSAKAPFVGHIEGPIDVLPLYKVASGLKALPILDIISFEEQPPEAPKRSAMVKTLTVTLDGSGAWSTGVVWKVTGRSRVRVTMASTGTHNFNSAIVAYAAGNSGGGATLDTKTITAAASAYADFAPNALYTTGATLPPPGVQTIDYVGIASIGSGTAADTVEITLQAWDE